tara:strand:+ start:485 stop:694 length:210 start_codon:yes stop_codon:yes gene_type:complete
MAIMNVLLDAWKFILKEKIKMNKKYSPQRKTTLKWNSDGDLSEIDMLRILDKISAAELNQCELTCDLDL